MTKNTKSVQNSQMSLFQGDEPLAFRIRPASCEDIIGQKHLFSENGVLTTYLKNGAPYSIVLWGPPGSGKTSIAYLAKSFSRKEFVYLSGASTSISELRDVINKSK